MKRQDKDVRFVIEAHDGSGAQTFVRNGISFDELGEAKSYAEDLACRWLVLKAWRIVEVCASEDRVVLEREY